MIGTLVNAGAIVAGGFLGTFIKRGIPEPVNQILTQSMGLSILLIGLQMAIQTENVLLVITSLVIGSAIGEVINIEKLLGKFGSWMESLAGKGEGKIARAFVTASLIYCVGAMGIVGSIEDGLKNNHTILYAKAALDGVISVILGSTLGVGVVLSAIPILLYQGSITLLAGTFKLFLTDAIIRELSATGGLLVVGIGANFLGVKNIRVGNMLPAIIIVVALALVIQKLGFAI